MKYLTTRNLSIQRKKVFLDTQRTVSIFSMYNNNIIVINFTTLTTSFYVDSVKDMYSIRYSNYTTIIVTFSRRRESE